MEDLLGYDTVLCEVVYWDVEVDVKVVGTNAERGDRYLPSQLCTGETLFTS